MILAGDVGGTKVLLALVEPAGRKLEVLAQERYETAEHPGLEPVVAAFLKDAGARPERAAFGVAGPVVAGRVEMTNVGWALDRGALAGAVGAPVELLNDLEATGYGLADLDGDQIVVLQEGEPIGTTSALVAAGTGLGMAIVTESAGRRTVLPSEGGHADFAARDDVEAELHDWLRRRYGHVSAERVVSGPGIENLWEFLVATGRHDPPADVLERLSHAEDRSAAISEMALEDGEPVCLDAMKLFVSAYGAVVGNLALAALALRGVWLGGGIAPAILPLLQKGDFLDSFRAKGRMRGLLERVPVRVVLEERAALLGAARYATLGG